MRRPSRVSRTTTVLLAVLMAALLVACALSLAGCGGKSYSITDCIIDSRVAPNGDLTVVVKQTFDFNGDFTRVYWDLPVAGTSAVDIVSVAGPDGALTPTTAEGRPPGTFRVTDNGASVRVEAYGGFSDETDTFTMAYRAAGVVQRYRDTAELYWQFIGYNAYAVPMDDVRITIHLPASVTRDQVRAWAHGPLNGVVSIEPNASVLLTVHPLPANTRVEARVLFPSEALSGVPKSINMRRAVVLEEEQAWADEANAQREAARSEAHKQRIGTWLGVGLAAAGWILLLALYLAFGREHKASLPGEYYRDIPPDLPPAIVDYLWNMGVVDDRAITATLVDLANKGVLTIDPVTVEKDGLLGSRKTRRTSSRSTRRSSAASNPWPTAC